MSEYDASRAAYAATRRPDPRIAAVIERALGGARTVVNVGAGSGSYESPARDVTAVEPSPTMRAQRPPGSAAAIDAEAAGSAGTAACCRVRNSTWATASWWRRARSVEPPRYGLAP